jgi:hypothetical protein
MARLPFRQEIVKRRFPAMTAILILSTATSLAAMGLIGTLRALSRDGLRRLPDRPH